MIYNGKTIKIATVGVDQAINKETNSSATITCETISGAGSSARIKHNYNRVMSWKVSGSVFLTKKQFIDFYNLIVSTFESVEVSLSGSKGGYSFSIVGNVIFTEMSFSADIRNIVKITYKAVGTGKPTIST